MPSPKQIKKVELSFFDALRLVLNGQKIARLEWEDANYFVALQDGHLKVHSDDNLYHDLILRDIDMNAVDWVVV